MGQGVILTTNLTRRDCRKKDFTGIRQDNLLKSFEIWMFGQLVTEVTEAQQQLNPNAVHEAYEKTFNMMPGQAQIEGLQRK